MDQQEIYDMLTMLRKKSKTSIGGSRLMRQESMANKTLAKVLTNKSSIYPEIGLSALKNRANHLRQRGRQRFMVWVDGLPVFHPQGYFRSVWNGIIMLLVCMSAFTIPLQTAFDTELSVANLMDSWFLIDTVIDVLFIIDICINFRTGYMSRGLFVKDTKMIAQNYLQTSFTLDMISSFPLSLVLNAVTDDSTVCDAVADPNCNVGDDMVFRLNRLLRLLRLTKLLRMMKLGHYMNLLADTANFNPGLLRLLICIVGTLLICHWIGCLWYLVIFDDLRYIQVNETHRVVRPIGTDADPDDTLHYPMNQIQGPLGMVPIELSWLYSTYWAASMITGFLPFNIMPDKNSITLVVFTTGMLFIGLLVNAIIISSTTSAVTSVDSAAQFAKQQLDRVTQYLQFQGVDANLRGRITEYYKYMLSASQSSVEQSRFFQDLPPQLAVLLAIEMNRPLIMNCQLFQVLDNDKILLLLNKLVPCTFLPKQVIIRAGQPSRAMYFIIRGLVCKTKVQPKPIMSKDGSLRRFSRRLSQGVGKRMSIDPGGMAAIGFRRNSLLGSFTKGGQGGREAEKPVMLTDHDFFGEIASDVNELPTETCIALTYCNISALSHADFNTVMGSMTWKPRKEAMGGRQSRASRHSKLKDAVQHAAYIQRAKSGSTSKSLRRRSVELLSSPILARANSKGAKSFQGHDLPDEAPAEALSGAPPAPGMEKKSSLKKVNQPPTLDQLAEDPGE